MINYLHCYRNYRTDVDWNTCGQAAIATITDYWGRNPYNLSRPVRDGYNGLYYWDDGKAIDAIRIGGFGPDVPFGFGTSGVRIQSALRSYGLGAAAGYAGAYGFGWDLLWRRLQDYLNWNRPIPVMVDLGRLGGPGWMVHWPIAYKIADGRVYLGNMSPSWISSPSVNQFLSAWHCWFLPFGFNFCGVYC